MAGEGRLRFLGFREADALNWVWNDGCVAWPLVCDALMALASEQGASEPVDAFSRRI